MKEAKPYRIAIIDLGSNTARLVLYSAIPGYSYRFEDGVREVVRLRQGLTTDGLSSEAITRAFSTLRLFKRFCDSAAVDGIIAVATSAVRDAANGEVFIERIRREIGLSLRILDGEREAYYATIGVLNEVPMENGFVLDIGGGSLQISEVRGGRFYRGTSLPIGSLALTERFILTDPITEEEFARLRLEVDTALSAIPWLKNKKNGILVGLGGTIRTLGRMDVARTGYPLQTLHGYRLTRTSIEETVTLLRAMTLKERQKIRGLKTDRADITFSGAVAAQILMKLLDLDDLTISTAGLREGLFLERFWQHLPYPVIPDVKRFGVLNLARTYQYEKPHANHVRYLAERMFQQLTPLHGFGLPEWELLDAAALLHDVGRVIGYGRHHRHSQTLIEYNGLVGFSPRETALIALLVRYHRRGRPDIAAYKPLINDSDTALLLQLSAILRMAEFLERGRNAAIDDVIVTWTDSDIRLTLIADEYPAVELWETERNAVPLFEEAFERSVLLDSIAAPSSWPSG